jgi:pantoate--beta-alanine ligase
VERVTTIAGMRERVAAHRRLGRTIGLVPTMGALHEGHLALVRLAAREADTVVVSVFVNPTQFDRPDDLAAYPRDLTGDERALAGLGAAAPALVFAPSAAEMYPRPPVTSVSVSGLTEHLCGASRPGHFDGVATIVTKLLHVVGPDVAVFGRKDRQQLAVIERLVADLDLPTRVVGGPTVREGDGVALSSRNRRLDADARQAARGLVGALRAAVLAARAARDAGRDLDPATLREATLPVLVQPGVEVDYVEVVDPTTMAPVTLPVAPTGRLVVAVAAFVGEVRLIDNVELGHLDDEAAVLAAAGGN